MNNPELRGIIEKVIWELAREKAAENNQAQDTGDRVDYVCTDEVFAKLKEVGVTVEKSLVTQEMKAISIANNWDPIIGISNVMIRVQSDIIP